MTSRSYELQMLDLSRLHFLGSRRSSRVDHSEVSPNQAFVLSELVRRECPSLDELRSVLKVHLATLSRSITHLNKVGMVKSEKDSQDSRRTRAIPTPKGVAFAKMSWVSQQAVIAERLRGFLPVERVALESFLRVFVGDAAYQRIIPIADEPEMAILSRALTYDHGVVTDDYLESGYSVIDWIMLSEIYYENRSSVELVRLTRAPPSTVSLRLKSLKAKGLVSISSGLIDKRARELTLSKKGIKELYAIEAAAQRYFARTLQTLPPAQIEQGIELFRRYVIELRPELSLNLHVERIAKHALDSLRRRLISNLVQLGDSYPLGAVILHPKNRILSLEQDDNNVLILECELQASKIFRLVNAIPLSLTAQWPSLHATQEKVEKYLDAPLRISQELSSFLNSNTKESPKA